MSCCLLIAGVAAAGLASAPASMNGAYWSSCGTSYCRGVHCATVQPASAILNKPTGYGYSVKYNHGLQPDWTRGNAWAGSSSYNYGSVAVRVK